MKKKINKEILSVIIISLFFSLSLFSLMYGIRLYGIGFHNYDLGFNLKYLSCKLNTTLVDTDTNFQVNKLDTIIINGVNQLDTAFSLSILGAVLLGLTIGNIFMKNGGK